MQSSLESFGLSRNPFAEKAGVVIATAPLRAAVERIRTDLAVGASTISVVGPSGIGKTTLARALPAALHRAPTLAGVALVRDPRRNWLEIRDTLTRQLGLPGKVLSKGSLSAACSGGRRLVLVVDRADQAGEEFFAHLDRLSSQRSGDDAPFFQCVLLSRPAPPRPPEGGAPTPLERWLACRRTVALEIDRLSPHGVQGYVKQQLLHAGRDEASLFTAEACQAIHRACQGIPARVNEICGRALEAASGRRFTELGAEFVEQVVATRQRAAAAVAEVESAAPVRKGLLVRTIRDAAERRAAQTRFEVAESLGDVDPAPVAQPAAPDRRTPDPATPRASASLAPWVGGVVALAALASLALR